ncbi:hypothetical protein GLOIN_2v1768430 [Rhizophagus irregularis DAOM 181602=DAOM 197198]|uniref:Uncharacterized protein n=1 Tax=Rhizophagus irregularis (strain DAOM 181602 / DAOM 197198 / MUCL 43194) TaxID=747089 RepID=A0A2P4QH24_RHIID|nr:hypothetical protein GLOIN_2v1768430 [Rhizophagus irregularis DAOM 181602=DAOM 197198]POG76959.1 hypothetical protein GLOIN_2v1768430 [Rhizophagus irregularis DAOM 181602=DAOM 197198]GBC22267.2 hypothetical protein GLOIN_2v1768430 [Rhizophagus irregularis DAOM 181602=DAOM 197198]CAG8764959.1 18555_t:CDS:2 [Rhizophagus irregularis]|eukprot:XP_025183825.1 hypothetical protein GLOIN_2v1768430 [Rhizophagus irregularis DAOM 181602=DAOM 197198]
MSGVELGLSEANYSESPSSGGHAFEKYKKCFNLALDHCEDDKLDKLRAVNNDEVTLQRDWETWLKEKKALVEQIMIQFCAFNINYDQFKFTIEEDSPEDKNSIESKNSEEKGNKNVDWRKWLENILDVSKMTTYEK